MICSNSFLFFLNIVFLFFSYFCFVDSKMNQVYQKLGWKKWSYRLRSLVSLRSPR